MISSAMKAILIFLSASVLAVVTARPDNAVSFTFGTWNIAHYSCGKTYPSNISTADLPKCISKYADFLDLADVSVLGVCEDSWFCDAAGSVTAREKIFPRYSGAANERNRPFDYNSIYWTNAVCVASGRRMFKKATEPRFYRWARLIVSGHEVMVVEAHLDWNITLPGYEDARVRQIQELIDDFKNERCVVIGGDFNTSRMLPDGKTEIDVPEDYEAFRAAGYVGAHWGTIKTWPAAKPFLTIDNIFAKGLSISEVRTLSDDALSDHALMRCRLTFDDGGKSVAVAKPSYETLIAHRGESNDAPENTLPAYRMAVERGFGFECDVYLSSDGEVFTFHDRDLSRTTGGLCTNICSESSWADVISKLDVGNWGKWKGSRFSPTRPALLSDVLLLARNGRYIYVEVKPGPEIVPHLKRVFDGQANATPANTLFISFDRRSCKALKEMMPEYKVLWLTSSVREESPYPPITLSEVLAALDETGADGVDCHFDPNVITSDFVKAVRDRGYEFHVWTVNSTEQMLLAFARGAQTVTTDVAKRQLDCYRFFMGR